jgi:hypothetical protein
MACMCNIIAALALGRHGTGGLLACWKRGSDAPDLRFYHPPPGSDVPAGTCCCLLLPKRAFDLYGEGGGETHAKAHRRLSGHLQVAAAGSCSRVGGTPPGPEAANEPGLFRVSLFTSAVQNHGSFCAS